MTEVEGERTWGKRAAVPSRYQLFNTPRHRRAPQLRHNRARILTTLSHLARRSLIGVCHPTKRSSLIPNRTLIHLASLPLIVNVYHPSPRANVLATRPRHSLEIQQQRQACSSVYKRFQHYHGDD